AADQTIAGRSNTPVAVTLTASDADGDPLTYRVSANVAHGALTGTAPNLAYIPDAGFVGTDTFAFIANDGAADGNPATVTIRVMSGLNRAPEAEDQWIFMDEDTPTEAPLLATAPVPDALTFTIVTPPSAVRQQWLPPNLSSVAH